MSKAILESWAKFYSHTGFCLNKGCDHLVLKTLMREFCFASSFMTTSSDILCSFYDEGIAFKVADFEFYWVEPNEKKEVIDLIPWGGPFTCLTADTCWANASFSLLAASKATCLASFSSSSILFRSAFSFSLAKRSASFCLANFSFSRRSWSNFSSRSFSLSSLVSSFSLRSLSLASIALSLSYSLAASLASLSCSLSLLSLSFASTRSLSYRSFSRYYCSFSLYYCSLIIYACMVAVSFLTTLLYLSYSSTILGRSFSAELALSINWISLSSDFTFSLVMALC